MVLFNMSKKDVSDVSLGFILISDMINGFDCISCLLCRRRYGSCIFNSNIWKSKNNKINPDSFNQIVKKSDFIDEDVVILFINLVISRLGCINCDLCTSDYVDDDVCIFDSCEWHICAVNSKVRMETQNNHKFQYLRGLGFFMGLRSIDVL